MKSTTVAPVSLSGFKQMAPVSQSGFTGTGTSLKSGWLCRIQYHQSPSDEDT